MEMILSAPVSTGFVASVDARLHELLRPFEEQVKARLADAQVAGSDETFVSLNGVQAYAFTFHDHDKIVWYGAHACRGHAALDHFGILHRFRGSACATTTSATTSTPRSRRRAELRFADHSGADRDLRV